MIVWHALQNHWNYSFFLWMVVLHMIAIVQIIPAVWRGVDCTCSEIYEKTIVFLCVPGGTIQPNHFRGNDQQTSVIASYRTTVQINHIPTENGLMCGKRTFASLRYTNGANACTTCCNFYMVSFLSHVRDTFLPATNFGRKRHEWLILAAQITLQSEQYAYMSKKTQKPYLSVMRFTIVYCVICYR